MNHSLTNNQFLDLWRSQGPMEAILDKEAELIDRRLIEMKSQYGSIVDEKKSVTGGDDWHDGAFRATDLAAGTLAEQHAELTRLSLLPHVDMPDSTMCEATLGSRILLSQNNHEPFWLDIVGVKRLHVEHQDIETATLLSPLGRILIGRNIGGAALSMTLPTGRLQNFEILDGQPLPTLCTNEE